MIPIDANASEITNYGTITVWDFQHRMRVSIAKQHCDQLFPNLSIGYVTVCTYFREKSVHRPFRNHDTFMHGETGAASSAFDFLVTFGIQDS